MSGGVMILNPNDHGLFRVQRGRMGADALMSRDVGTGGRYVITTGEAPAVNGGTLALPIGARRLLDPHSPGFAMLVLVTALFLIHGNFAVSARGALKK